MSNVGTDVKSKNVFDKPLYAHSKSPPTGFARDGFCRAPPEDKGNHSVAGTVTDEFLDFSASKGNDLRKQAGVKGGQKWCLCASRWKEAFDAASGNVGDKRVPKVTLHASDKRALDVVSLKDLQKFDADQEVGNMQNVVPNKDGRGPIKEHHEISSHTGGERASASIEGPLVASSRGHN